MIYSICILKNNIYIPIIIFIILSICFSNYILFNMQKNNSEALQEKTNSSLDILNKYDDELDEKEIKIYYLGEQPFRNAFRWITFNKKIEYYSSKKDVSHCIVFSDRPVISLFERDTFKVYVTDEKEYVSTDITFLKNEFSKKYEEFDYKYSNISIDGGLNEKYNIYSLMDNDYETFAVTNNVPNENNHMNIIIELKKLTSISVVDIIPRSGYGPCEVKLHVSEDGLNWDDLGKYIINNAIDKSNELLFNSIKTKFIKIEIISSYDVVYPSRNIQIGEIIIE